MTTTTSNVTTRSPLVSAHANGWRGGLGNLMRKEFGQWWTTRLWWIQVLIWVVMLNGITTVIMLDSSGMTPQALFDEAVQTFLLVAAMAIGIGVVLTTQGSIVGEKELGTAAWVMSKPASRASFILAKLAAHVVGFAITALLIPAIVFAVEARLLMEVPLSYGPFAIALSVLALGVLFYVALTLALGAAFKSRGPVAGIGIALILVGQFFKGMLPLSIVVATPWLLGDVASSFVIDVQPDFNRLTPILATSVGALLLVALAIWRFHREEF